MITSLWEIKNIGEIVREVKQELEMQGISYGEPKQGIMIETPAAAMKIIEMVVDELSVSPSSILSIRKIILETDLSGRKQ